MLRYQRQLRPILNMGVVELPIKNIEGYGCSRGVQRDQEVSRFVLKVGACLEVCVTELLKVNATQDCLLAVRATTRTEAKKRVRLRS